MKDLDVEVHEAGHALAFYYYGIPLRSVSTYSADGHAGRCRGGTDTKGVGISALDIAAMCVAGQLAEKRALGFREVFNWFDDDPDAVNAANMVDAIVEDGGFEGDVFDARRFVELKARSLLVTKWHAVQALAAKLRVHHLLTGDEVAEICKREGVQPYGTLTKAEAMVKMTPEGRKRLSGKVRADGKVEEVR